MRTRKVTIITLVGLTLTLILQVGGLFYAYRSNMEMMKLTVKKSFSIAFYETIDNLVNQQTSRQTSKICEVMSIWPGY